MLEHLYDVEKGKFISEEFKSAYNLTIREAPQEWMDYNLCMLFKCLPSELGKQNHTQLMNIVLMHNVSHEIDDAHDKLTESMNKGKKGKGKTEISKHLAIALEIEKLKNKK